MTVRSSRFGHLFDHGIDLLHPPFWYYFWGVGLVAYQPLLGLGLTDLYWLIGVGYIAGRAVDRDHERRHVALVVLEVEGHQLCDGGRGPVAARLDHLGSDRRGRELGGVKLDYRAEYALQSEAANARRRAS